MHDDSRIQDDEQNSEIERYSLKDKGKNIKGQFFTGILARKSLPFDPVVEQ